MYFQRLFALFFALAMGVMSIASTAADAQETTVQWRPVIHYAPERNWMNDPNGLVYTHGTWHLFYQYNPFGSTWGNMSWGHATSTDLVHWHEQPVALMRDERSDVFSGSVVVDSRNSSGLGKDTLVALYTSVSKRGQALPEETQAQSLAFSRDGGKQWARFGDKPVLTLDPPSKQFRDPKVFWYDKGGYWVMATVVADAHVVKFYRSKDLVNWRFLSDFGPSGYVMPGMLWEMPDLIELPVDDNPADTRWVLLLNVNPWGIAGGSGAQYFVGQFDGTRFTPESQPKKGSDPAAYRWVDHGADFYAAGTFSGAPGKPVVIAWMSNWDYASDLPTFPWKGAMTFPRELALRKIDGRVELATPFASTAVQMLERGREVRRIALKDISGTSVVPDAAGQVQLIRLTIEPRLARLVGVTVRADTKGRGTRIYFDSRDSTLHLDRSTSQDKVSSAKFSTEHIAAVPLQLGRLELAIVVDRGSVEVCAQDGRICFTDVVFPPPEAKHVSLFSEGGTARLIDMSVLTLE